MLPSLKKSELYQSAQMKLYNPPRQLPIRQQQSQRKTSFVSSSRTNSKNKALSGFKRNGKYKQKQKQIGPEIKFQQNKYKTYEAKQNLLSKLQSTKDLSQQIKLIQKKIRYHKKKLEEDKKKKLQMQKNQQETTDNDFQKIIRREMELQGYKYQEQQNKNFDYLTNPGKNNLQQQIEQQVKQQPQPIPQPKKPFSITQGIQKLQKHYENNLKKKFERRQMFPHQACKRKTPKLYITQKTNALQKYGAKPSAQQHLFRILTKQVTPQQIYPTIPNFAVVKDSLSKNVMAYLGDYKPFLQKTKQQAKNQNSQNNDQNEKLNVEIDEQLQKD